MQEAANVAKEQALALLRLQRRVAEIDAMAFGDGEAAPGTGEQRNDAPSAYPASTGNRPGFGAVATMGTAGARSSLSIEDRRRFGLDDPDASDSLRAASLREGETQAFKGGAGEALATGSRSLSGDRLSPVRREACDEEGAGHGEPQSPAVASRPVAPRWSSLTAEDRVRFGLDAESHEGVMTREAPPPPAATYPPPALPAQQRSLAFQQDPDILWGGAGGSREAAAAEAAGRPAVQPSMSKTIAQLEAVGATKLVADLKESERRLQSLKLRG